jgi:predicted Zn-dependent peptidase
VPLKTDHFGNVTSMTRQMRTTAEKGSPDYAELLKKLAELKNAGILTEAEFEQKKKHLLSRM